MELFSQEMEYFQTPDKKSYFTKSFSFYQIIPKPVSLTGTISLTSRLWIKNIPFNSRSFRNRKWNYPNRKWNYSNRKWNYANRKWNYFYNFQTSDQKTNFTNCFPFLLRIPKQVLKTGNGIIQTGNGIIQIENGIISLTSRLLIKKVILPNVCHLVWGI